MQIFKKKLVKDNFKIKFIMRSTLFLFLCFATVLGKPVEPKREIINMNNMNNMDNCANDLYKLNCSKYSIDNNSTCILCKTIVSTIDFAIKKGNTTIQELINLVKHICCIVNGPSGDECIFVLNNIQEIIKLISNGLNNLQVCQTLHLCS